ncbi:hypothetical protein SDC9_181867 [bioreactor metagenome]|uniref:Uncharacterized protein n=1 Tax=bioreactor metagenome TaxID=1076179 RepID=A0A645HE48_9ZZZZ
MEQLAYVVDALALEEYDRIGAVECSGHKTLGVIRRHGIDDLEARDVRAHGGPILGMLRAVFYADRHPERDRHLDDPGAHGLPFGHLVEYIVGAATDEVAVHDLDQRTTA